jgi:hypothetical protein
MGDGNGQYGRTRRLTRQIWHIASTVVLAHAVGFPPEFRFAPFAFLPLRLPKSYVKYVRSRTVAIPKCVAPV